ncbi:MAG: VCBS repeat-containing protein, partial [Candidatus Zixiibacteriota bacterium]
DRLMQYAGNTFIDITTGSGLENIENVFCPVFFDIDGDYDDDLFNAGNWELNYGALFRNNGDGTFTDISTNTNQGGFGFGQEVTFGDIDNDRDFDIYLCSGFGANSMWENDGTGFFTNITAESNTGCGGYSRGASFADFDNDGDLDLFVNRSTEPKMLYLNDSTGVFTDVSVQSGVYLFANGFGCSTGDIDNDGQMDIIAANCCYEQNFVFINQNTDTNFVKIKVMGRNTNTLALGAIVELFSQEQGDRYFKFKAMREISSHATLHGTNELVVHFGTGSATKLAIRIHFQSGAIAETTDVDPGSMIIMEEPEMVAVDNQHTELPSRFLTAKAYPNPFNNSIKISLVGGKSADYRIDIYNIMGEKIRSERIKNNNPLTSFYIWDGRNNNGDGVGSGIYLIKVYSGSRQARLKAALLR